MNGVRTYHSNHPSPFKTPLTPLRRGKKIKKSRLEINHHNYNSSINCRPLVKDFKPVVTSKHKSNHSTSSKSQNKRKLFKCTRFPSKNLVDTPAVNMIYNISKKISKDFKRSRNDDYFFNPPKRRRLDVKEAQMFEVSYLSKDYRRDRHRDYHFSQQHLGNMFGVDKKVPDQNENLYRSPEELNEYKPQISVTCNTNSNNKHSLIDTELSNLHEPVAAIADSNNDHLVKDEIVDDKFNLDSPMEIDSTKVHTIDLFDTTPAIDVHTIDLFDTTPAIDVHTIDLFDTTPAIDVKCESVIDTVNTSKSEKLTIYAGQLLWARYSSYPYWPAIVWPFDTDLNKDPNQFVHVRFCANKGSSGWVKMENVFEFQGIESFLERKKAMTSRKLTKSESKELKEAFNNTKKSWAKAVVEATFIMSKDLELRLPIFDVVVLCSLREIQKKNKRLSEIISKNSSKSQLEAVEQICKENPNFSDDINKELNQLSSIVNVTSPRAQRHPSPSIQSDEQQQQHRRHSAPTKLASQLKRRSSVRLASVHQTSVSEVDASKDPVLVKEEKEEQKQKKINETLKRREQKRLDFETDLKSYDMKSHPDNILFQGSRRGNICKVCFSTDVKDASNLVKCSGACGDYVHTKCVHATDVNTDGSVNIVVCHECIDRSSPVCYACKMIEDDSIKSKLVRCSSKPCGRYYHVKCLDVWLQTKFTKSDEVLCPLHVCHTCVSDDPRNKHYESTKKFKLTRCVKCPSTFHIKSSCVPAGIRILTQSQHICIRHRIEKNQPVHLNWCYICGQTGGTLLCCESCPQTVHITCLNITVEPDHYFCDGCETARHPLYGEVVWAKLPSSRWWPAIIVPPFCIPLRVEKAVHQAQDLCVRFFGTYDFAWIGRSFVYLYEIGDAQKSLTKKTPTYDEAIVQAADWLYKLNVSNANTIEPKQQKWKPKPYKPIHVISQVPPAKLIRGGNESHRCNCSLNDNDPCGPTSSCENRACLTECDASLCPCESKCKNQQIDKKVYPEIELKYMGEKGFGLIANQLITAGTFVIEYVGELVTEKEFQNRLKTKQNQNFYFMKYDNGLYIDAEFKGNVSRFMNHSCKPNCEPQKWAVNGVTRIGLFALIDIPKGTEITFNYEFDDASHSCFCGEDFCSGIIGRKVG